MADAHHEGDLSTIMDEKLILASSSPRRRELMKEFGMSFCVEPTNVAESVDMNLSPVATAILLAERKAAAIAEKHKEGIVIGADTVVAIGDETIGKPHNRDHAKRILARISGARQAVITGVCVINCATGQKASEAEITWVTMRKMTKKEISEYVASGEADGKAGAYAIQETGDRYVERIEGPLDNVVGLPLDMVRRLISDISAK